MKQTSLNWLRFSNETTEWNSMKTKVKALIDCTLSRLINNRRTFTAAALALFWSGLGTVSSMWDNTQLRITLTYVSIMLFIYNQHVGVGDFAHNKYCWFYCFFVYICTGYTQTYVLMMRYEGLRPYKRYKRPSHQPMCDLNCKNTFIKNTIAVISGFACAESKKKPMSFLKVYAIVVSNLISSVWSSKCNNQTELLY